VNAETLFLGGLAGSRPEAKRKFIGATFIDVFEDEARRSRRRVPRTGTLYPM